jgi:hypothetical protein
MNNPRPSKTLLLASLAFLALLTFAGSARAVLTYSTAFQTGAAPFTPTFTVPSGSLINGLVPTVATGNFDNDGSDGARNVNTLTTATSLTLSIVNGNAASANYVECGNSGGYGSLIQYTLPAQTLGYNITNITVIGGWANSGRDSQDYVVLYSTVQNPTSFTVLTNVAYLPAGTGNPDITQVVIYDTAGGVIAGNVYALQFIFSSPPAAGSDNGWCGYAAITAQGTVASSVASQVVVTTATQTANTGLAVNGTVGLVFTPAGWPEETTDILTNLVPTVGSGNFTEEVAGRNPDSLTGPYDLTISQIYNTGGVNTTTSTNYVTCGGSGGSSLIYTLSNAVAVYGQTVTNIAVYNGWTDNGRDGQYYTVSYSTVSAPGTYIPITTVYYLPSVAANTETLNRVGIFNPSGAPLASNVCNLQFNFASPISASGFNNGYQGYAAIIAQGSNSVNAFTAPSPSLAQDTLPASALDVVGDQISFTAAFTNLPSGNGYEWVFLNTNGGSNYITTGITNVTIDGITTSTLTLTGLTLGDTGSYQLQATNSTNNGGAAGGISYSTAVPLVVNPAPEPDGNIIVADASETGWGAGGNAGISTNFIPTWDPINPASDLIYGFTEENGQLYDGGGDFNNGNLAALNADSFALPDLLSDGTFGYLTYWPGVGDSPTEVTCGDGGGGNYVVYDLGPGNNSTGFDLTNIVVYGGWGDDGRNEQKYTVSYATYDGYPNFTPLMTVDYNPATSSGTQSATRTTITPLTSVLAHNVQFVEFDFDFTSSAKNGWEGYSEIVIGGQSSGSPVPELTQDVTPLTAEDVVGSQLTLTAAFSSGTPVGYQWQQNGTNINGATSTTLTLIPLTLSDAGNYVLVATNAGGSNTTSTCIVTIDPAPAATNNIVTAFAYQTSLSANFSPTWTDPLTSSLIYGASPINSAGDFQNAEPDTAASDNAGGVSVLTDGYYGAIDITGNTHPAFAVCGDDDIAGEFVTYAMPDAGANGDSITSIQIAGGWNDDGRDSQYYTILYSTVDNPTLFNTLTVVQNDLIDYGVSDGTFVRATFTPVTGVLAANVAAIEVNFLSPTGVPNGFSGYAQIAVYGMASSPPPPLLETNLTPLLSDVPVGAPMTFSVTATSTPQIYYQWSNQSGAISGATNASYSFNALPGSNSYYVGISNINGSIKSATAVVIGETTPPPIITIGNGTNWTFNEYPGSPYPATVVASNIIETSTTAGGEGDSAFYNVGQYVGGFVSSFWYQDQTVGGADGTTFCLQNAPGGPGAVGATGGSLGYSPLSPSAAFELNIYVHTFTGAGGNTAGPGIQFGVDGIVDSTTNGLSTTGPINIAGGDEIYVQLYYMGGNLEVLLVDPSAGEFTTNYVVDLPAVLGNGSAYVGITGGDGGLVSEQFVSDFIYSYTTPPYLHVTQGTPGNVVVSWPISVSSLFRLVQSSSVTGPWTTAATAPFPTSPDGTQNQVTLPATGTATFYELQLAPPYAPPYVPPANP